MKDIISGVVASDEASFRRFYDRYRPKIYTVALKLLGEKTLAEDVVQDTFLKVWINRESLPTIENVEAWLHRIAKNVILNMMKKAEYYKVYA